MCNHGHKSQLWTKGNNLFFDTQFDNTTATQHLPWICRAPQSYRLCQKLLRKDGHSCKFTGPKQTNKQTNIHTLTYKTQDEKELASILVETEVYRLRIHNGTDQVTFSCEKPWGWDDVYVREERLISASQSGIRCHIWLLLHKGYFFKTKGTPIVEEYDKTLIKMLHRFQKRDLSVACRQIWVLKYWNFSFGGIVTLMRTVLCFLYSPVFVTTAMAPWPLGPPPLAWMRWVPL